MPGWFQRLATTFGAQKVRDKYNNKETIMQSNPSQGKIPCSIIVIGLCTSIDKVYATLILVSCQVRLRVQLSEPSAFDILRMLAYLDFILPNPFY